MRVTGLITQGAKRIGSPEYVKSYKVAYSDDGKTWRTYKVKGKDEDMVRHTHTQPHKHRCTHSRASPHSFPTQAELHTCHRANTHTRGDERPCAQSRTGWRT